MPRFYAPYNFVPATGQCNGSATATVSSDELAKGTSDHPARHDLWQGGKLSGRILCGLTTTSPLVVGGQQSRSEPNRGNASPTKVDNYLADDGRPALPASSLRGLIANVAETLSQSSLRVLVDKSYSVRKAARPGKTLSAVGRLHRTEQGEYKIEPLSFPFFISGSRIPQKWLKAFKIDPDEPDIAEWISPYLPAYVDGYAVHNLVVSVKPGSFLADPSARVSSKCAEDARWYARPLEEGLVWNSNERTLRYQNEQLHNNQKVMRARLQASPSLIQDPAGYSGFIKVLGFAGHESEIPHGKKHELFIFEPENALPLLPITPTALENFRQLVADAEQREAYLPFRNAGAPRSLQAAAQEGQLFYFDVEETGENVLEFSYSGIWRMQTPGSLYGSIKKSNEILLPLDNNRDCLTPAELLFGVVREEKRTDNPDTPAPIPAFQALASRVRFSDAQAAPGTVRVAQPIKLQILSSPKPPSPSMYFGQRNSPVPSKASLTLAQHQSNGRKFYLPFPQNQRNTGNARSSANDPNLDKQKLVVSPIESGQTFYFEVIYENLSSDELGLLLTSLRPDPGFEHRLGLAKALGFGHTRIDVLALMDRNRPGRYTCVGFFGAATLAWADRQSLPNALPHTLQSWGALIKCADSVQTWAAQAPWKSVGGRALVDDDSLAVLVKLGSVASLESDVPVYYPRSNEQLRQNGVPIGEEKLFAWFVANDRAQQPQVLAAVSPNQGVKLPTLSSNGSDH